MLTSISSCWQRRHNTKRVQESISGEAPAFISLLVVWTCVYVYLHSSGAQAAALSLDLSETAFNIKWTLSRWCKTIICLFTTPRAHCWRVGLRFHTLNLSFNVACNCHRTYWLSIVFSDIVEVKLLKSVVCSFCGCGSANATAIQRSPHLFMRFLITMSFPAPRLSFYGR